MALSEFFAEFNALLNTKRGREEKFKNFEFLSTAQVAKLYAHFEYFKLSDALVAFMLLVNTSPESTHRVSLLITAAPKTKFKASTTTDYLKFVIYEFIMSVLCCCDRISTAEIRNTGGLYTKCATKRTYQSRRLIS